MIKRWVILLSLVIMLTCDKIGDCSMQIITPNDYITVQLDCSRNQIKVSKKNHNIILTVCCSGPSAHPG